MGIKDWLGGDKFKELLGRDKKKDEYREAVKEAVSDGKLDTEELKNLEELRKELDVSSLAEDRTVMRLEIYNEAVQAVRKEGEFTATDAHDLNKIQKFSCCDDRQVEQKKWNLTRRRVLSESRQGNYPTVAPSNVALRGVQREPEEMAHYTVAVELFDQSMTRGNDGVAIAWGVPYESGAARIHGIPEGGAKPVGEGNVIVTNRRLILKTGNRMASVKYGREAQIHIYGDGIRPAKTVGNTLLKFKSDRRRPARSWPSWCRPHALGSSEQVPAGYCAGAGAPFGVISSA